MKQLLPTLLLCLAAPAAFAQGEWRTQVQVSVDPGLVFAFDGGLNDPASSTSLTGGSDQSFAEASSSLNASGYIPTLRARAVSSPQHAQAVAWGVQAYTNTSGSPLVTSVVLQLDADITGANDVEARVYLFEEANFEFYTLPGTMLFESSSQLWPGSRPTRTTSDRPASTSS